ncbi:MAG: tetratricopeptide repeat protein [Bacteroidales bacterium]
MLIIGSGVSGFSQGNQDQLLQKAEEAFNTQKWKSAGTLYDLFLKDSMNYSPFMAKAMLANQMAADSVSDVRTEGLVIRNNGRLEMILGDYSRLCIKLRHFDAYEETLSRLRNVFPEDKDSLLYGMIKYRLFLREPKKVIQLAQKGRLEQPENILWLKLEAEGWLLLGDANHAIPVYRQILQRDSTDLDALLFMGNYFYMAGKQKLDAAEKQYSQQPNNSRIHYAAHRAQLQSILDEDLSRSAEFLEKANEVQSNKTVSNTLYEIYVLKSEVEKANKMKKNR